MIALDCEYNPVKSTRRVRKCVHREGMVSLSFIFPDPPEDEKRKKKDEKRKNKKGKTSSYCRAYGIYNILLQLTTIVNQEIASLPKKTHPYSSTLQLPTTQLAKMTIDLKFVELTADVLEIFSIKKYVTTPHSEKMCARTLCVRKNPKKGFSYNTFDSSSNTGRRRRKKAIPHQLTKTKTKKQLWCPEKHGA